MTAPDDLARTLAQHRLVLRGPHAGTCYICGPVSDYYEHLASVVSRRDADLRKRIDKLTNSGNHATGCVFWRSRATHIECDCWLSKLRDALNADTDTGSRQ